MHLSIICTYIEYWACDVTLVNSEGVEYRG